jgi:hypothetical protein
LINNRQGGRRRGRGGQGGGRNLGGQPGNRQDNRQRGNAAQLLEKYKSMARDAQLAGDRVQTEYFLQFADHYFRVLSESRARFEDQNPRRQRDDEMDEDDENGSSLNEPGFHRGDDEMAEASDGEASDDEARRERPDRQERYNRHERQPRRAGRDDDRPEPRRPERPERADRPERMNGGETIPFDALPPAIGRDEEETPEIAEAEPKKPRRRARAPRPEEGEDEATA